MLVMRKRKERRNFMGQDHEAPGIPFTRPVRSPSFYLPTARLIQSLWRRALHVLSFGLRADSGGWGVGISHGASKTSLPEITATPQAALAGGALAWSDLCSSVWLDLGVSDGL